MSDQINSTPQDNTPIEKSVTTPQASNSKEETPKKTSSDPADTTDIKP